MPFQSEWPYRRIFGRKVDIATANFDGDQTAVAKGPDYQLIDNESSTAGSSSFETMTESSAESAAPPKKKTGFFASVFGLFKRKKTPPKSETIVSIVSVENGISSKPKESVNASGAKQDKKFDDGFENPVFTGECSAASSFQSFVMAPPPKSQDVELDSWDEDSHMRFQEQWDRFIAGQLETSDGK